MIQAKNLAIEEETTTNEGIDTTNTLESELQAEDTRKEGTHRISIESHNSAARKPPTQDQGQLDPDHHLENYQNHRLIPTYGQNFWTFPTRSHWDRDAFFRTLIDQIWRIKDPILKETQREDEAVDSLRRPPLERNLAIMDFPTNIDQGLIGVQDQE